MVSAATNRWHIPRGSGAKTLAFLINWNMLIACMNVSIHSVSRKRILSSIIELKMNISLQCGRYGLRNSAWLIGAEWIWCPGPESTMLYKVLIALGKTF